MVAVIPLVFGADGARAVSLAPLTGAVELQSARPDDMLACLAQAQPGCVAGEALARLTLGDRDRALAGLYRKLYGAAIRADATCVGCKARFEMRFDLDALVAARAPDGSAEGAPPEIRLGNTRLRLPCLADLGQDREGFLAALTLAGPVPDEALAAAALEAADPALVLDLRGTCPECHLAQDVPFSMAQYLGAALARDRSFLLREVHLLAASYHWPLAEILSLARADRQALVRLILAERDGAGQQLRRVS